jgi:hypothetical protein
MTFGIYMFDTWGQNYNMRMFESTRDNIDFSFERLKNLNSKEVIVNDFFTVEINGEIPKEQNFSRTDYKIIGDVFSNDMRDERMTQEDLNKLAEQAHKNGMKIVWRPSMSFNNIGKYISLKDIQTEVTKDFDSAKVDKNEEWVKDFIQKWRKMLLEEADMLNLAGFDAMIITPGWMDAPMHPHEELANSLWKETIKDLKQKFKGKVFVIVDRYGYLEGKNGEEDWTKYDYYKDADGVYYHIYHFLGNYISVGSEEKNMEFSFDKMIDDLEAKAKKDGIKLSLIASFFSIENSLNTNQFPEFSDFASEKVKNTEPDWDYQARAYDAFFASLQGRTEIEKAIAAGYWWDDVMDIKENSLMPKISISPSQRNKPAEAVLKKWASSMN